MTQKVGVVIIHGVGDQRPDYADNFIERANKILSPKCNVFWEPVHWADSLPRDTESVGYLYKGLRNFFDNHAFDGIGYFIPENYDAVHERVASARARAFDAGCTREVILAHSLGSIIAANHIHDQEPAPELLITFGSSLRRYLSMIGKPPSIKPGRWINYFYPTDLVAKRISGVAHGYEVEDIALPLGWNPLHYLPITHSNYWIDNRFIKEIAHRISEVAV